MRPFSESLKPRLGAIQCPVTLIVLVMVFSGCAWKADSMRPSKDPGNIVGDLEPGTILSGQTGQPLSIETLMADLKTVTLVFVGESHPSSTHHAVQLRIIEALNRHHQGVAVALEMFSAPYQPVLEKWRNGGLDEPALLQKSHWYANWRFPFELYRDILIYVQYHRLPLYGINVPFHIPAKIAIGGIDSLLPDERTWLPKEIDTTNTAHREYVQKIFQNHQIKGREDFEHFYEAQCVWEDGMASAIAANLADRPMVVLAGNGHIVQKFGIPDRAARRTGADYRTVYLVDAGGRARLGDGDYIWITERTAHPVMGKATLKKKQD